MDGYAELVIRYGPPWALVVLGAILVIWPPRPGRVLLKLFWIAVLVAGGGLITVHDHLRSVRVAESHQTELNTLEAHFNGVLENLQELLREDDRHAYFHLRGGQKHGDRFLVYLQGIGDSTNVSICRFRVLPNGARSNPECPTDINIPAVNDTVNWPVAEGRWLYEFSAADGTAWFQYLEVRQSGGVVTQDIEVRRTADGRCLYCATTTYRVRPYVAVDR